MINTNNAISKMLGKQVMKPIIIDKCSNNKKVGDTLRFKEEDNDNTEIGKIIKLRNNKFYPYMVKLKNGVLVSPYIDNIK